MHNFKNYPNTDPTDLFRLRDSIYAADLFIASLCWLDLFSWLSKNPSDKNTICKFFEIADRPCDVMLTLLSAMELIKNESGIYSLTDISREYLVSDSVWNLEPYFSSLKERPICKEMLQVLKTDKPASWGSKTSEKEWSVAMERADFVETFTAAMDSRGAYLAPDMAKKLNCTQYKNLLDIAGGSGIYACSVVNEHKHMKASVLEKPPVDKVAKHFISKKGIEDQVSVLPLDMFNEQLPLNFDIHLYSHAFHDWDEIKVRELLLRSFQSLTPGGMIAIYDMHINDNKTGPLSVAEYSALLMYSTEGKCYSICELTNYLKDVGFIDVCYIPSVANRSLITALKPKK